MTSSVHSWLEFSDGSRFDLEGTTSVGRSPENTLSLADNEVSRRHAIIQLQGEKEFWIVDLGSSNGTYLNGRRISQPVQLQRGDVLIFSSVELRFRTESLSALHPKAKPLMASTMMRVQTADCWMMMADIVGSTKLSQEVTAEELPRITGSWFKACREVIEACGGHIMKYLGDGFFCYWQAAPECVEQIHQALNTLKPMQDQNEPPFRIVIHYGKVALGSVPTMAELNLHGQEVNFAFRIEKVAANLKLGLMLSDAANSRLGLPTQLVHTCGVDGFQGDHHFYSTDLPRA